MWEVIGFELQQNDAGEVTSVTLFAIKPYKEGQGVGQRARRVWYRANEINYIPQVGEKVMIETETRGKYEIVTDVIKL